MIITISGLAGAGKSTLKRLLAERLNLKAYSIGDMRGKMALDRGMTIDELNALGEKEAFTDTEVDAFQEKLGQTEDNFVIDGWLSWHFIPQSLKVFATVDPAVGAKRIFDSRQTDQTRADEPEYKSLEETVETLKKRLESNKTRYQKWYGVDFLDPSHYDLIIDTSMITPEEAVAKIIEFLTISSNSSTLPPV